MQTEKESKLAGYILDLRGFKANKSFKTRWKSLLMTAQISDSLCKFEQRLDFFLTKTVKLKLDLCL